MMFSSICRRLLLCALGCLCLFGASGDTGKPIPELTKPGIERMDRSWKRYKNPNLGYCVSYPSRWSRGSAFDGSGLLIETGLKRYSKPIGEIDIGPMNAEISEDARSRPVNLDSDTLDQDLKDHLAGLQKFARAEKLEIIDQHKLSVQGFKALFLKNRYYDPLERTSWMEEVVFVKHHGELFRMELQCKQDQIGRFEPVFSYLVNTFEFDCK